VCSWVLLLRLFDGELVGRQGAIPELIEVGAQLAEAVAVDLVDAAVAGAAVDNETRVLEHLEVLGDRGPADGQPAGELADRARASGDALEDRAPGGIAKGGPAVNRVSRHSR